MDATGKEATGLALEGKITKILYKKPQERSILEVFRNYEEAVIRSGVEILYSCDQKKLECVQRYAECLPGWPHGYARQLRPQ